MNELHYHTPLKGAIKRHAFCAFDVEGVGGAGGFWCGAVFCDNGSYLTINRQALWKYILDDVPPDHWRVSHNLEYDLSVLNLPALLNDGAVMGDGGLLWYDTFNAHGDPIRFVDSLNLFRGLSVHDIGLMVGLPKLELPGGLLDALRYGYPLDDFGSDVMHTLQEYNLRDAEIIYRAMNFLQDMVNDLGGELRETIGSTSHDLYRRVYMPHAWPTVGSHVNDCAREGFYGGRVEPYRMQVSQGVNMYDVNSLYPHIMKAERFPHPGSLDLDLPGKLPDDLNKREGVICCRVHVPDMYCPPLPARMAGGLFFPTGNWTAAFAINELRHALDCGVTVDKVEWMLSTRNTFNPFAEFVQDMWNKRQELAITNTSGAQVIKMILNSHIGRYGVRVDSPLTTFEVIDDYFDPVLDQGLMWDRIGKFDYIERPIGDGHSPTYANVFFASQVSAGARVFLHQAMTSQGNDLVYVDTDCIQTRSHMETGPGLGQWKCELLDGISDVIGPKEYICMIDNELYKWSAKGVPPRVAAEYLQKGCARYQKAITLRQARTSGHLPAEWVEVFQQRGSPIPKRDPAAVRRDYSGPVKTRPWDYSQLALEVKAPAHYRSWRA